MLSFPFIVKRDRYFMCDMELIRFIFLWLIASLHNYSNSLAAEIVSEIVPLEIALLIPNFL